MKQYLNVLKNIMDNGHDHGDRTGTGRRSVFGTHERFNLQEGFPLVTTRKIFTKAVIVELLWFIKGSIDNTELKNNGTGIWDKWCLTEQDVETIAEKYCDEDPHNKEILTELFKSKVNTIGPMYGHVWRNAPGGELNFLWPEVKEENIASDKLSLYKEQYEQIKAEHNPVRGELPPFESFLFHWYYSSVDQLNELVNNLKSNPYSSRHIVTAWIPSLVPFEKLSVKENIALDKGALAACHMMFQCFVSPPKEENGKNRLSLKVYIRSNDVPIGAPYNIAQYALLTHMLAQVTDMEPYELIWDTGDAHVYLNQKETVLEQLEREPYPLPTIWLNPEVKDLFKFTPGDIRIDGYQHHPVLKYEVSK
jgi:thymidylate synthase